MDDADVWQLTDDEVVAIAIDRKTSWVGGTPTIERTEGELAAAAFRARRSLYVRGLRPGGEPAAVALEHLLEDVFGAEGRLSVYLGDGAYRRAGWGLATTHHQASGGWIFEALSPLGIHRLSRRPVEDHRTYVGAIVEAAVRSGPARQGEHGSDIAEWLCVLASGSRGAVLVAARRDEVVVADVEAGEERPMVLGPVQVDQTEALERLFTVAGSA